MDTDVTVLSEPELEFRYGQRSVDPHAGLGLFGPFDAEVSGDLSSFPYAAIGTPHGLEMLGEFMERVRGPVISAAQHDDEKTRRLWPVFPGAEAALAARWPSAPIWSRDVDAEPLLESTRQADPHRRVYEVVNAYLDQLRIGCERDERPGFVVCVVPDEVYIRCRVQSRVSNPIGRRPRPAERRLRRRTRDLFDAYDPEQYDLAIDFRRQLKARAMEFDPPIQIIRESTLRLVDDPGDGIERGLSPLSDRAWNLTTAMYYKAGRKPWRLAGAREGVCYIGIAFRHSDNEAAPGEACCAAQMFLDTGDGVVFRGEFGPWASRRRGEFHLTRPAARDLLSGVLDTYREQGGKDLREVFLHCRSSLHEEEWDGYMDACPSGVDVVGIRVRKDRQVKLYREGRYPVLRGTTWITSKRSAFLCGSGFKPAMLTYDGWETPQPLRIDIQRGEADIRRVAQDIFALTKLNYNACKLGDNEPVTIGFSDAVGEILISNPTVKVRRPNFKYYI